MQQLLIRASFILFIILLYYLGFNLSLYLSSYQFEIDFSKILPFFSLAFYDYWLNILDRNNINIDLTNKFKDEHKILAEYRVKYTGNINKAVLLTKYQTYGISKTGIYDVIEYSSSDNKKAETGNFGRNLTSLGKKILGSI